MFWKLSFRQPCAIDNLLEKEDCTLEEILDEDDVLQECKSNNKKLTDFLARPEIMERLMKLICFEPAEDAEDKVKFKYPHLACELLTSEVFTIVEQLSSNERLLAMLWEFLDNPNPLNPLLASFISKVITMLLSKEASVIVNFIKTKEDFLTKFMNHLGTSAIMDLLLQMVSAPTIMDPIRMDPGAAPTTDEVRTELATWLIEQRIVERLVDFIKDQTDQSDPDQCVNASLTLCEMTRVSRESYQLSKPAPLHQLLESKEILQRLLRNMFSSESPSDVVIINGISVLLANLRENMPFMDCGGMAPMTPEVQVPQDPTPSPGVFNTLEVIVPWLKDFHSLLTRKPEIKMSTTVGVLDPPLGNMRLQVVKLISSLLARKSSAIAREIISLDMFSTLISLFFAFPWNNFLHMQVELCIESALNFPTLSNNNTTNQMIGFRKEVEERKKEDETTTTPTAPESADSSQNDLKSLRVHLLKESKLVSRLLEGAAANDAAKSQQSGRRQGYMGYLVRMANNLVKFGEKDEELKLFLDEATQQEWNNFVNGPLVEMNKKNETNLGGNHPLNSAMDDSDDDFDQLGPSPGDSELEKAYQQYLDVKYTGSFLDEYGVEDELSATEEPFEQSFTRLMDISRVIVADEEQTQVTSLFEAVCSERIRQFDDEESEEEEEDDEDEDDSHLWADKDPNSSSPMDHHSASSDDEEYTSRREFPTGESFEDVHSHKLGRKQAYLKNSPNIITQITSSTNAVNDPNKMEIGNSFGMISWKSDLSGDDMVIPMDTGSSISDWTKEPDSPSSGEKSPQNPGSGWADFSKFSAQSMEDEPSVTPSHITVTYITRDLNASNDDEDFIEPSERPDSTKYSMLSPGEKQRRDLDPDGIEVAFDEADIRCSDSDEDLNSSDSDEERSGRYNLNVSQGSETDELLNSLNDSREQEMATSPPNPLSSSSSSSPSNTAPSQAAPSSPSLSSSSSKHDHQSSPSLSAKQEENAPPLEGGVSQSSRHNMVDGLSVSHDQKVPVDGEVIEDSLQENYAFLSKGLLSNKDQGDESQTDSRSLVEQKRAEALEACVNYDKEVSVASTQKDSIET